MADAEADMVALTRGMLSAVFLVQIIRSIKAGASQKRKEQGLMRSPVKPAAEEGRTGVRQSSSPGVLAHVSNDYIKHGSCSSMDSGTASLMVGTSAQRKL